MKNIPKKILASIVGFIGWLLSPLTWWNDAFINLPIAWFVASLFAKRDTFAFLIGVNLTYWATNVLGFLMMHWGGKEVFQKHGDEKTSLKSAILSAALWSLAYSAVVTALILFGVIKPLSL